MTDATPLYSDFITNWQAVPVVKMDPYQAGGRSRSVSGTLTLTSAQVTAAAAGDTWAMVKVPTRARVRGVKVTSDALDTGSGKALAVDLGVYLDGQPGVLANTSSDVLWLSAATTFQAAVLGVDQSLAIVASKKGKRLWDLIGLASDPGGVFDIAFKVTTAAGGTVAGGSIQIDVDYVDGD